MDQTQLSLQEPLPFQCQTTQSTTTQFSIQNMLNSLKNGLVLLYFLPPYLFIKSHKQSLPTILSSISTNFHPPFFFTKPSLQSPPKLPSARYQPFFVLLFLYTVMPTIPSKTSFPDFNQSANSDYIKGPVNKYVLCALTLFYFCLIP